MGRGIFTNANVGNRLSLATPKIGRNTQTGTTLPLSPTRAESSPNGCGTNTFPRAPYAPLEWTANARLPGHAHDVTLENGARGQSTDPAASTQRPQAPIVRMGGAAHPMERLRAHQPARALFPLSGRRHCLFSTPPAGLRSGRSGPVSDESEASGSSLGLGLSARGSGERRGKELDAQPLGVREGQATRPLRVSVNASQFWEWLEALLAIHSYPYKIGG